MGVAVDTTSTPSSDQERAATQVVIRPGKVDSSIRPARAGFMKLLPKPP